MRFLTYSYDACGLGHLRRTLVIGRVLAEARPESSVLSIVGSTLANNYFQPESPNHDYIKIPSMKKVGPEIYEARHLPMGFETMIALRTAVLDGVMRSFGPDMVIVDKNPTGLGGELVSSLEALRSRDPAVTIVLGLRDILDEPQVVRSEWSNPHLIAWVQEMYDAIWIWGEPEVYNSVEACGFPEPLRAMTRFLGYFPPEPPKSDFRTIRRKAGVSSDRQRLLLLTAGGGGDALPIFLKAIEGLLSVDDPRLRVLLVSGPLMSGANFRRLNEAARPLRDRLRLVRFLPNFEDWLRAADAVICMGGYNTLREVAALSKPTLVIPRTYPRQEQRIRALEFAKRGWCQAIDLTRECHEVVADFCRLMLNDQLQPSLQALPCRALESLLEEVRQQKGQCQVQAI